MTVGDLKKELAYYNPEIEITLFIDNDLIENGKRCYLITQIDFGDAYCLSEKKRIPVIRLACLIPEVEPTAAPPHGPEASNE